MIRLSIFQYTRGGIGKGRRSSKAYHFTATISNTDTSLLPTVTAYASYTHQPTLGNFTEFFFTLLHLVWHRLGIDFALICIRRGACGTGDVDNDPFVRAFLIDHSFATDFALILRNS